MVKSQVIVLIHHVHHVNNLLLYASAALAKDARIYSCKAVHVIHAIYVDEDGSLANVARNAPNHEGNAHAVKYADFLSLMAIATAVKLANPPHAIVVGDVEK